ncbi:heme biosynthesis HemY N-terminal domain-containing protein [Salaquimonas pukyongi]|uniref:heme biosynthesis HemY N-terminal domain-containing protein n=1 Tax=Salaquimonas pukyongi TaxID=2712698 RepID=UPI00096BD015|nr:heme biosynthesis HemY N-terminal domain-containing protein [Salaquimonas pukyongi]
MLRILLFLLLVFAVGFGFAWFADRPGDVMLQWQGNSYQTSLMVVLVGVVALVALVMITWWLLKSVLDSPRLVSRFFRRRKRDQGYQALTRGLIAANSGDAGTARRYTKESARLLGRGPLVDLLDAQSSLLEGKREDARARFEAMLEDDETRLVALRGLYLEAERQGASEAARHYATEAHKAAPTLAWAGNAKLRYSSLDGDWEGAIATLEANRSAGLVSKEEAKRQRAVLLTAQAMSEEPADPVKAAKLAREAHKLAPDLVPAAVIGAKALARNSDIGRAAGMIETVWKKSPHPELADAYVHLRIGDSATDRLKRAKKLAALRPNHPEGSFAIAESAIDAKEWKLARDTMKGILSTTPSERACLLMAEIEEAEFGDKGRMRDWLSRAVRAPKDAVWTADGYVSEKWLPVSPLSGRIDAFEWKVPVEQLGAPQAAALDAEGLEDLINEPPVAPVAESAEPVEAAGEVAEEETTTRPDTKADEKADGSETAEDEAGKPEEATIGEQAAAVEVEEASAAPTDAAADASGEDAGPASGGGKAEEAQESSKAAGKTASEAVNGKAAPDEGGTEAAKADVEKAADKDDGETIVFPLDRRPDDPGVLDDEPQPERKKRFGLF